MLHEKLFQTVTKPTRGVFRCHPSDPTQGLRVEIVSVPPSLDEGIIVKMGRAANSDLYIDKFVAKTLANFFGELEKHLED